MDCSECRHKVFDHYVEGAPTAVYTCGHPKVLDTDEGCPLDSIDSSAVESFTIACGRCGRAVELNDTSMGQMQYDHTNMVITNEDLFRTYPINLNFGSAGGYGMVEFSCKCGNTFTDTE